MLHFLPGPVLGCLSLLLLAINTVLWCIPFYIVGIARLVIRVGRFRDACARTLVRLAELWIDCNEILLRLMQRFELDVRGGRGLSTTSSYLVASNHQSWVDIPVLQFALNRRIPFLKVFVKQELIWVPLLGLTWWFLDYPFMKRYPAHVLEKHPELRGKDLETTRRSCRRFLHSPVSVLNFFEGTRLTGAKHAAQASPYANLLRPRAGGAAFVLEAMGGALRSLVDVTVFYPYGVPTFWDLLCGRVPRVIVSIEEQRLPPDLIGGDYLNDPSFRERFQRWVAELWQHKDTMIDTIRAEETTAAAA